MGLDDTVNLAFCRMIFERLIQTVRKKFLPKSTDLLSVLCQYPLLSNYFTSTWRKTFFCNSSKLF